MGYMQGTEEGSSISSHLEGLINDQIRRELEAAHQYEEMDVSLSNFSQYFSREAEEEREHARRFISFLQRRGGNVKFQDLRLLHKGEGWTSTAELMRFHLEMENTMFNEIRKIREQAKVEQDDQLEDLLDWFYNHQVDQLYSIRGHLTNLDRVGHEGIGCYLFDQLTMGSIIQKT